MATTSLPTPCSQTLVSRTISPPAIPRSRPVTLVSSLPDTNAFPSATNSRRLIHSPLPCVSSSTSSAPLVDVDLPGSSQELGNDQTPFSGCKTCGREEIDKGCNGEGRIQGGIATVPGFGWWPIKAYRPCPGFVASGGRYRRKGQSMDEVASGGGGRGASAGIDDKVQTRKKRPDQRKSKR